MDVIYGLIPGMILMGLVGVGVFFWAAKSGQFEDMQGEAHRILMDDDLDDDGSRSTPGLAPDVSPESAAESSPEKPVQQQPSGSDQRGR